MLPRTLNRRRAAGIFKFHCKYSYYAYYRKLAKCCAVTRSCKNVVLRAVAGLRSRKKLEGTLHAIYDDRVIRVDFFSIVVLTFGEEYTLWSTALCNRLPLPIIYSLKATNILLRIRFRTSAVYVVTRALHKPLRFKVLAAASLFFRCTSCTQFAWSVWLEENR
jgi:hypothetical protein